MNKTLNLTVVLLAMVAYASDITWKGVCESKGHTLILQSEHFEICKKALFDDGSTNNVSISESDANKAIKTLEHVFSFYHDSLKWMYPQPSNATSKFKSVAYIFENSKMGALYGGTNDEACDKGECSPGLWLGSGALSDNWGLAHEYAHGLQGVAGWIGNNSHTGWIAESHANWMAHQVNSTDAHYCSEALINFPYLYYGSTRDRYCNWQFFEHLKEVFGGGYEGVQKVNSIWTKSIREGENGRMEQTPFTAMLNVYGWQLKDLNEQFGRFAMKNATLEYAGAKKALYKNTWGDYEFKTRRTSSGWGDMYRRHTRVTMLNLLDKENNRYISPSYWAPERFGYNLVRIYPNSPGKVTIKFRGIVQQAKTVDGYSCFGDNTDWYMGKMYSWCNYSPDKIAEPASSWTVGLIAEDANGSPRYSEMKSGKAFNLDIETFANDKALWLAVTATPTEMQTILWDQFYYSIYRYPYMVEVSNGKPEGFNDNFWKPANASSYTKHENGGGLVSSKAQVAKSAYIGENAVVNGGSVLENARIEDFAVVDGGRVSGNAIVKGRALVSSGTVSDYAVLEDDAWLVSGSVSGHAKVGALSIIVNTSVSQNAKVYGVMWAIADKKLSGTAELRGDLENNFSGEISKGIFYGMVDDGMLTSENYGANRTEAPVEVTASIENALWYNIDEDNISTEVIKDSFLEQSIKMSLNKKDLNIHLSENARVYITDLRGNIMFAKNALAGAFNANLKNLSRGIYIIVVKTSNKKFAKNIRIK